MDPARFRRKPLIGIVRGVSPERLEPVLEAAIAGGLETLEITLNTPGAPGLIARAGQIARGRLALGAGTVLDGDGLKAALDAGASFIVSPTLVPDVVAECVERRIPVFPGALTPQEIHDAWRAGATMVKVFPARLFGPDYFAEIRGPFDDVPLLACGGISPDTLPAYAAAGADAFAVGGSVFRREWMESGDCAGISRAIRELIDCAGRVCGAEPDA